MSDAKDAEAAKKQEWGHEPLSSNLGALCVLGVIEPSAFTQ